jgi:hypothetical protein
MTGKFFVVGVIVTPILLWAEGSRRVDVGVDVPVVAQVDGPAAVRLDPGETRRFTMRVACNQPWLLNVQTDNPLIHVTGRHKGHAGGMGAPGNTFWVTLTCSPAAEGPQQTYLTARLASGPLAAGLLP